MGFLLMSKPGRVLVWMLAFLAIAAAVVVFLFQALHAAFLANAAFNGLIIGVLLIGVAVNFRQVLSLSREVAWVEEFRRSPPDRPPRIQPRMLAPMARMLSKREGGIHISALSARTMLDGIRMRIEESRDLSRYLTGLLVFLGLLGTFWGLLITINSVSDVIAGLQVEGDGLAMFGALQEGLQGPLSGMGVAFSSSLFGLAGSLMLGFLDLQAGHAQNRFFNELEDWLSGVTRLSSGSLGSDGEAGMPAYVQALLEQTADSLEQLQRAVTDRAADNVDLEKQIASLASAIGSLTANTQSSGESRLADDLRQEFRLLNRTIAAALEKR
ncbi:MAG: hypothetical protein DHS20C11_32380 [Lysobacteraceae bacterium]|nr:MAG: hypothetical protein DHS20C11_32380 [Xanthomonadaceae bacterium]